MIRQTWRVGLLALAGLGLCSFASAEETLNLGIRGGVEPQADVARVQNLGDIDTDADNIDTHFYRRRGFGFSVSVGGYGGYGGYYRSYYPSYYGYRSYSYYPRYYSYSYSPRYYGYSYYSYPSYSYYAGYGGGYYCPISGGVSEPQIVVVPAQDLQPQGTSELPSPTPSVPAPMPKADEGTFEYDGGPTAPVPMPKAEDANPAAEQPTVPLEGRAVSAPAPQSNFTYPAYGEAPSQRVYDAPVRTILIRTRPER